MKSLVNTLDRETGLGSFYEAVNTYMPKELLKPLFGRLEFSKPTLGKLTDTSVSTIRWQIEKLGHGEVETQSTLSKLLQQR